MPTYEYICTKCEHQFEKFQLMAEDPLTTCPKADCGRKRWGKGKVKRLISAGAGLIFKGSGFYITDYRSENYKAAAKKDSDGPGVEKKPAAAESTSSAPPAKAETKTSTPKSNGT
jgi:putative FmdB family regulatory protein